MSKYSNNSELLQYSVKVSSEYSDGAGTIIYPNKKSNIFYVLTAKHIFFKDKKHEHYTQESIILKNIRITHEQTKKELIKNPTCKIYFIDDPKIDFALIKINSNDLKINTLKIYNIDSHENSPEFVIAGYPIANNQNITFYPAAYSHPDTTDNYKEVFYCHIIGKNPFKSGTEELGGLSGGGVFLLERYNKASLRGIK